MMDTEGTPFAEVSETTSFLHHFSGLPDHRQAGKVDYPLPEVLLLILLAVLAGEIFLAGYENLRLRIKPASFVVT